MAKTSKPILFLIFSAYLFLNPFSGHCQTIWSKKPFEEKVFIENKGQFDKLIPGDSICFGAKSSGVMVLFSVKGITYCFRELISSDSQKEQQEEEREKTMNTKEHMQLIPLQWLNSNKVIPRLEDYVSDYYTYPKNKRASAGKKLVYYNLYKIGR